MGKHNLSEQEKTFCELYVNGSATYVGNAGECYKEAFQTKWRFRQSGRELLIRDDIQSYIEDLQKMVDRENKNMKLYLTENLKSVISETVSAKYYDRNGTALSPAPLRSVAVGAMKLLADMYPVKEAQVSELNINGSDGSGITFNVIVPENKADKPETAE